MFKFNIASTIWFYLLCKTSRKWPWPIGHIQEDIKVMFKNGVLLCKELFPQNATNNPIVVSCFVCGLLRNTGGGV